MLESLREQWDVVVVGAGVAGAVAASRLARRGMTVLLVDKAVWPRDKVCGGCVNAAALRALAAAGIKLPAALGQSYSGMQLAVRGRQARFALPLGRAISRRHLDATLVEKATEAGAHFLSATRATLDESSNDGAGRWLHLRCGNERTAVRAKVVLACDGLKSKLLRGTESSSAWRHSSVAQNSRIGAGTVLLNAPAAYEPGTIHMACGEHGYVGLVRVEQNRLNIGAALDPAWTKSIGGPADAIKHILSAAGFPVFDALDTARWRGTPRLTRRHTRLGAHRLFALGDAAGYVEPFTGEGMAWSIAAAAAVEPLALAAVADWHDELIDAWSTRYHSVIGRRQRTCAGVAALLRRPRLVASGVRLAAAAPGAVTPFTAWLNRDFRLAEVAES